MLHAPGKIQLLLLVLFATTTLHGQHQNFPIEEWKNKLSVKKDDCAALRREVFEAIHRLDSIDQCPALYALEEKQGNKRFHVRVNMLQEMLASNGHVCPENSTRSKDVEQSLQMAYEIEDNQLAAE